LAANKRHLTKGGTEQAGLRGIPRQRPTQDTVEGTREREGGKEAQGFEFARVKGHEGRDGKKGFTKKKEVKIEKFTNFVALLQKKTGSSRAQQMSGRNLPQWRVVQSCQKGGGL